MEHLKNFIILPVIHESSSSKAGLSFFKNVALPMHPKLLTQCAKFKCAKGATHCCCRRILYNQPDFVNVKSTWKLPARPVVSKLFFSQNFTVRSISLSSVGDKQNGYTAISQCLQRRLILKQMSLRLWNQCH